MESVNPQPRIPESFFEHRQLFAESWVDRWIIPNPFISELSPPLRAIGVELADFSFNKDAANVGENYLNISIRRLNAAVRIGLDTITFIAANPDWGMAPELVRVFDQVSERIRDLLRSTADSQEATLAFHVIPGTTDFRTQTASLVNQDLADDSLFCGISIHRKSGSLMIDKSLKHEGAAFVRIQRKFSGDVPFAGVASRLYDEEVSALRLLGIAGVP